MKQDEWLQFDPYNGWLTAKPGEADRAAKAVLRRLRHDAGEAYKSLGGDDLKVKRMMRHVQRSSDAPRLHAMVDMATSEPGMTARLVEFDQNPNQLGVANGVLDIESCNLVPVCPELRVSKRCAVAFNPTAKCPRFEKFLAEVAPAPELRRFLRRLIGYCLTGNVNEHIFPFLYGHGANGKSVFVELFAWMLGDYSRKLATDMLMHHNRNPQGPSPDIVSLKGTRFAYANETEEGRRLAEARIKELTGGDTLIGRVPYGKAAITFRPTHKLFMVGNHKPDITDMSAGMWRRVALVPFDQTIPEGDRDPKLLQKLQQEGSGILNWALVGLQDYLRIGGLHLPTSVRAATDR